MSTLEVGIVKPDSGNRLVLQDDGGGDALAIETNQDVNVINADLYFGTAGKGIVLGATSNVDANTLDDYEEGTWTPTHSVFGFSSATGHYTKIGNLVTFSGRVVFNNTATSDAVWGGLPFSEGLGGLECGGNATWTGLDINTGTTLYPRITDSGSTFSFYAASDNAGWNNTLTSASSDHLAFFGFYYT